MGLQIRARAPKTKQIKMRHGLSVGKPFLNSAWCEKSCILTRYILRADFQANSDPSETAPCPHPKHPPNASYLCQAVLNCKNCSKEIAT